MKLDRSTARSLALAIVTLPASAAIIAAVFGSSGCTSGKTPVAPTPQPTAAVNDTAGGVALPEARTLEPGEYRLALSGTAGTCGLPEPQATIYLAGKGVEWQVFAQPGMVDAEGRFDGTTLTLAGTSERSWRPGVDCVVAESERWIAVHGGTALEGTLTFERSRVAGHDCADPDAAAIPLPCRATRGLRLEFASAARSPKVAAFVPEPDASDTPSAKPTPKPKGKSKKR
jgi:hypothetical protein